MARIRGAFHTSKRVGRTASETRNDATIFAIKVKRTRHKGHGD